ncbi:MAG: MlaD family protein, partial [Mycobacterium sp.]
MRFAVVGALVVALIGGLYVVWPRMATYQVVGYFASAAGIYPGDKVLVVGVPVGSVESITPQADAVKITMRVKDGVKLPADARAVIMAPNLVAARFVQLT